MLFKAIICYIISIMITALFIALSVMFFKKSGLEFSILHSIIGALSAAVIFLVMVAIMMYAFSEHSNAYMSALMPEWIYKTAVTFIFIFVMLAIRFFTINGMYFSKYKESKGVSFLTGFGLTPLILAGVYCLLILAGILINTLQGGFVILTDQSVMKFGNDSLIPVFTPFYTHICISIDLASYSILMHAVSVFMHRHSRYPYSVKTTFLMFLFLAICEGIMLYTILFFASKANTILISVFFVLIAIIAILSVIFLYRYKEEKIYDKQFEV